MLELDCSFWKWARWIGGILHFKFLHFKAGEGDRVRWGWWENGWNWEFWLGLEVRLRKGLVDGIFRSFKLLVKVWMELQTLSLKLISIPHLQFTSFSNSHVLEFPSQISFVWNDNLNNSNWQTREFELECKELGSLLCPICDQRASWCWKKKKLIK